MDRVGDLEERLAGFEDQARSDVAAELAATARDGLVVGAVPDMAPAALRTVAQQVRNRIGSGVVVLGAAHEGKGGLVAAVTAELVDKGVSAGEIIASAARILGGGGSRDPDLAQAGGPHGDRLEEALEEARTSARAAMGEG